MDQMEAMMLRATVKELDERLQRMARACANMAQVINQGDLVIEKLQLRLDALEAQAHPFTPFPEARLKALEDRAHLGCGCRLENTAPVMHVRTGSLE